MGDRKIASPRTLQITPRLFELLVPNNQREKQTKEKKAKKDHDIDWPSQTAFARSVAGLFVGARAR